VRVIDIGDISCPKCKRTLPRGKITFTELDGGAIDMPTSVNCPLCSHHFSPDEMLRLQVTAIATASATPPPGDTGRPWWKFWA